MRLGSHGVERVPQLLPVRLTQRLPRQQAAVIGLTVDARTELPQGELGIVGKQLPDASAYRRGPGR